MEKVRRYSFKLSVGDVLITLGIPQAVLLASKISGAFNVGWFWVFTPVWLLLGFFVLLMLCAFIMVIMREAKEADEEIERKHIEDLQETRVRGIKMVTEDDENQREF